MESSRPTFCLTRKGEGEKLFYGLEEKRKKGLLPEYTGITRIRFFQSYRDTCTTEMKASHKTPMGKLKNSKHKNVIKNSAPHNLMMPVLMGERIKTGLKKMFQSEFFSSAF